MSAVVPALGYKIAVLVFVENTRGEQLLLLRNKAPNRGSWSPLGGKLETSLGESPFECAVREAREEAGLVLEPSDLHLFAMIAERAYEGQSHWLLFLFRSRQTHEAVPPEIAEGRFAFFSREAIDGLAIPETDRKILWPLYDQHRDGFVALRAECDPSGPIVYTVEEFLAAPAPGAPPPSNS
jgi:8-oxo-dGTP diphosphatase